MTDLVKPANGGRLMADGTKAKVVGTTPTAAYILTTSKTTGTPIRFTDDQVVKHTDGKYYIKGLAGTSAALVEKLPATFQVNNGVDDVFTAIDAGVSPHNLTGDERIDG